MANVHIIYGDGYGKTACAMGLAVKTASVGETVSIIQFLKGAGADYSILNQIEGINFFTFENSEKVFEQLTPDERGEQREKVKNSFQYARKVIETGSADLVILDEVLGLRDYNILDLDELLELVDIKSDVNVILTGRNCPEELKKRATLLSRIEPD
ncbi:MAG: cob(I)yrinic acid a,c-diamide adenosyltransferase [Lachnospiraceae bacterium]|jgi:cob(I)alamin adenosyltransferase|nr:cob(I)yrinic acid a,c-diamide adenosyltransferase [Lachnospiraceae bacterium]